ncbi:hypothetical protein ACHAXR_010932 [Thalassiosira sp. AJA248-18]
MASMASASSGPVRRNFTSSSQRKNGNPARAFFLALLFLVTALSALAVHLSRKVMMHRQQLSSSSASSHHHRPVVVDDAPKKGVAASSSRAADNHVAAAAAKNLPIISSPNDTKDRVYCMIPFIWNEEMYNVIMETWGKRCDVINFLTDSIVGGKLQGDKMTDDPQMEYKPYWEYPEKKFPDNVIFINMTRTWNDCPPDENGVKKVCRHIWEKMWRSWVYVEENHLNQAEWFCKVDYDTFFFPANVKYFVRQKHWNHNEHHYFGHLIAHRQKGRDPMIVGAAACWSQKTLEGIAEVYRKMPKGSTRGEHGTCEDRAQATEEVSTSYCLKTHLNVSAYPARDDEMREYISVSKFKDVLKWNRTEQGEWWFWKGKPKNAGQMENALAIRPIGLHKYKTDFEIRELEQHFYGPPDNKVLKRLDPRTKTYVNKVRKAIGTDP